MTPMRKTAVAGALLLLLMPTNPSAQQTPAFAPFGVLPVLEAYLEALRQQAGIPGMSAVVVHEGQILWERGFGFQNVAARIRATPDTPYIVGNLSETLAAVLLLQCVEHRRLELDAPLRTYATGAAEPAATLRQILSHSSSDPNVQEPFAYRPERFEQLTAVMEYCAPQSYRKSVAHRLLNRLAMMDSIPGADVQNAQTAFPEDLFEAADVDRYRRVWERLAIPYRVDNRGRAQRTELPPMPMTATGGLVTTVRDLARFDAGLDTVLLLDETRGAAWTPTFNRRGEQQPMGLGWFVQFHRGQRIVWHFGNVPGAYSSLVIKVPALNITFILLANSDSLSAPFSLPSGDLTKSLFGVLFLRLFT